MEVSERLRCSAYSSLEREHCFSFEMQSPFWSAELMEIKYGAHLYQSQDNVGVVLKLFTKCQKHILSVQYPRHNAWSYLGFQKLCQPLLQICTIYHRKQSSFGVIWIILHCFFSLQVLPECPNGMRCSRTKCKWTYLDKKILQSGAEMFQLHKQ